jgi:hypothetical protein
MSNGVWLPATFSDQHAQAVFKYLEQGRQTLSKKEWQWAISGFDLLANALIQTAQGLQTFAKLYETQIEEPLADRFIDQLLATQKPAEDGVALWARYARLVTAIWHKAGWQQQFGREGRLLLTYWLYWWESFAIGYTFEATIFQDLRESGIDFVAHDLHSRTERLSAYDLELLGAKGDIKSSLYFLQSGRKPGMRHDFYISRFREGQTERIVIVLLRPTIWKKLNGDTLAMTWKEITTHLPQIAAVKHHGQTIVVIRYEVWKERVMRQQEKKQGGKQ